MFALLVVAIVIFVAGRFAGVRLTANRVYGDYAGGISVFLFCLGLALYPIAFGRASSSTQTANVSPLPSIAPERRTAATAEPTGVRSEIESLEQAAPLVEDGARKGLYRVDVAGVPGLKGSVSPEGRSTALAVGRWNTFEAHLIGSRLSGSAGHGYGIGLFDDSNSGLALNATNNQVYVFTYNKGTYSGSLWAHPVNLQDGKMHAFALRMTFVGGANTLRFIAYLDGKKAIDQTTTSIAAMAVPGPAVFGEIARDVYFRPDLKFSTHG